MTDMLLGIQLYTVRDDCDRDFRGTVRALAEMGYAGVEFAWKFGGMSPEQLARFIADLGLQPAGFHASIEEILDPESEMYDYLAALDCPYVTTSMAPRVRSGWEAAIEQIAQAAAVARGKGRIFTYHHHSEEFSRIEGECALDMLLRLTAPDLVRCELDTFWIRKGGEDPVDYIRKYAGRVPQIHLKDMHYATADFTEVGSGGMDLPAIFQAAADAGAQWMLVEQDICPGPALTSARTSIENLKHAGLI